MAKRLPPMTTLLVLDAEPLPRLGRLTGRVRIEHADESTLAERLPNADVLLVWDFTSGAVRRAWPGEGPRPRWVHTASAGWTISCVPSSPRPTRW